MNLNNFTSKLVGSEDERAVSPVIGVILMVAITVILAAVIAAFVLDLGGSVDEEAQAGVDIDVDEANDEIQVEITSLGNSDSVELSGTPFDGEEDAYDGDEGPDDADEASDEASGLGVGDTFTISTEDSADISLDETEADTGDIEDGTITAIAVIDEDDIETQVGSEDYDLDWEE